MPRLALFSDLHLEFTGDDAFRPAVEGADIVVLAGDIWIGTRGIEWAARTFSQPVLYIAGNHEFYEKGHFQQLPETLRAAAAATPNVRYLEDEVVTIDGVRFVGATFWVDFCHDGDYARAANMHAAKMYSYDYGEIRMARPRAPANWKPCKLRPEVVAARHGRSRRFIETELARPFAGPTVVVSHHAPAKESISSVRQPQHLDFLDASDVSALMHGPTAPALWLHGHVHHTVDIEIGATRVRANPRGYPGGVADGGNPDFDPALLIEL